MERLKIDLGDTRDNEIYPMFKWKSLYVGACDGDVTIRLGKRSASALHPDEFNKLHDVRHITYLYVTNTAQAGKELVIYYEEDTPKWYEIWK